MAEIRTDIAETFERKRVAFYECDYKERFRLSEVLRLSAEIAGRDYTDKGLSHEYLWQHGMVFLVSKVSFKIYKYPTSQQKLISSTWESGKKGAMLKKIATLARQDLENFFQIQVNLQCWVKVKEDWRNSEALIRSFGLSEDR